MQDSLLTHVIAAAGFAKGSFFFSQINKRFIATNKTFAHNKTLPKMPLSMRPAEKFIQIFRVSNPTSIVSGVHVKTDSIAIKNHTKLSGSILSTK